jgi:S-adenosylmethionine:tRNA ribosyltransferase-isomerase
MTPTALATQPLRYEDHAGAAEPRPSLAPATPTPGFTGPRGSPAPANASRGLPAPRRLRPASTFAARRDDVRLLVVDPAADAISEARIGRLPELLWAGDLVVLNDAATLPASLSGRDDHGHPIELRLARRHPDGTFSAVLFGAGDWRTRTEHRPAPPRLTVGARLHFPGLRAEVVARSRLSGRLWEVRFDREEDALWTALYRIGRPVQYAHLAHELPLWAVQNVYASRPWSFEMPSAGRALSWQILIDLRRRGVEVARLTHAAGLSATGDPDLDARLPLPEPYDLPPETVAAIERTRQRGGRVVAVGTTVVRALEGAALDAAARPGEPILRPGPGETDLRLGPHHELRVVQGLLSGLHDPEESHFQLLRAFAPAPLLESAHAHALSHGYLSHELGDTTLILPGATGGMTLRGGANG